MVLKTAPSRVQCVFLPCGVRVRPPSRVQWDPKTAFSRVHCVFLFFIFLLPAAYTTPSKRETKKKPPLIVHVPTFVSCVPFYMNVYTSLVYLYTVWSCTSRTSCPFTAAPFRCFFCFFIASSISSNTSWREPKMASLSYSALWVRVHEWPSGAYLRSISLLYFQYSNKKLFH